MDWRDQEPLYRQIRGGLPPRARRRVHDYITAHLDQKITNDTLAQIAGLSTTHLLTEGMSPRRYVLQCRVQRTQQLLTSTAMSVAEIADAVGSPIGAIAFNIFEKLPALLPATIEGAAFKGMTIPHSRLAKRLNSPDWPPSCMKLEQIVFANRAKERGPREAPRSLRRRPVMSVNRT